MTLVWAPGFNGITDPDAQTYIAAVEAADGQAIEGNVAYAINDFVVGCKDDGIWDAIKASCILAGARTLSGALVPLTGTAPTNNNFVAADYNRETGLVGDGSTKYLNSNRSQTADPQNNHHLAVYVASTGSGSFIGAKAASFGNSLIYAAAASSWPFRSRLSTFDSASQGTRSTASATGFIGLSRSSSNSFTSRVLDANETISSTSTTPVTGDIGVFTRIRTDTQTQDLFSDARLSFYSIGEAIDLEKLDTRVTLLMNHISYSLASGLPSLSTMDPDAASYIGGAYRAGGTLS